jgi:hypothetical protein
MRTPLELDAMEGGEWGTVDGREMTSATERSVGICEREHGISPGDGDEGMNVHLGLPQA